MPAWLIGSGSDCDLVVAGPGVSDHHCLLRQTEEGCFLEDLGTPAGTFVNGARVDGRVRVDRSLPITLGRTVAMPWPDGPAPKQEPKKVRVITIGREPDNDVVIDAGVVSGWHARVVIEDGRARIEDLGSSNGTYVNSREKRIQTALLAETDTVFLGSCRIPARRLLNPEVDDAAAPTSLVTFRGSRMVFGRGLDCDQVLDFPMISRRHARLLRSGGQIRIEDLGSSNGTYVNGARVARGKLCGRATASVWEATHSP